MDFVEFNSAIFVEIKDFNNDCIPLLEMEGVSLIIKE